MSTLEIPELDTRLDVTKTGLSVKATMRALTMDEWSEVGRRLEQTGTRMLWWIGDWLVMGQREYGYTYDEAMRITSYAYQTLRNAVYVASNVEMSLRKDKLSWYHHLAVAPLAPWAQQQWLDVAEREGLTVGQLRNRIRGDREMPAPAAIATLRFTVAPDRAKTWQAAADHAGVEFDEWAANALDQAAGFSDAVVQSQLKEIAAA